MSNEISKIRTENMSLEDENNKLKRYLDFSNKELSSFQNV